MTLDRLAKHDTVPFVPETVTPAQQRAEVALGRSLVEYVTEKRAQRRPAWSWRQIATQLYDDTNGEIEVSHETLRLWYGPEEAS